MSTNHKKQPQRKGGSSTFATGSQKEVQGDTKMSRDEARKIGDEVIRDHRQALDWLADR